jgi:hypothetical protein
MDVDNVADLHDPESIPAGYTETEGAAGIGAVECDRCGALIGRGRTDRHDTFHEPATFAHDIFHDSAGFRATTPLA